jgi:hypothetical protein
MSPRLATRWAAPGLIEVEPLSRCESLDRSARLIVRVVVRVWEFRGVCGVTLLDSIRARPDGPVAAQ